MKSLLRSATLFACFPLSFHTSAQALSTPANQTGAQPALEEVEVTAQRREEKIQTVPIAITAIAATQLKEERIQDNYGLVALTPGLTITQADGTLAVTFLRGVGSPNSIAGDEPSVSTYVDGFYQGPAIASLLPFNNLERIEILKGPQGTLYGRNATGGLINLITPTPRDEFFARGSVGYDNYDTFETDDYVTGPISDVVKADLAVHYRDQNKGVVENLTTGHHVGVDDGVSLRSKVLIDFSDNVSLTLGGDYSYNNDSVGSALTTYPGTTPLDVLVGGKYTTTPYLNYNNTDPVFSVRAFDFTGKLRYDSDLFSFISMSQYRHYTAVNILDGDGTSSNNIPFLIQPGVGPTLATLGLYGVIQMPYFYTQEFQLLSNSDGPFSWITGIFGQDSKEGYSPSLLSDNALNFSAPLATINAGTSTNAYAAYAQGTYAFDNGLSLTVGARYNYERKHTAGSETAAGAMLTDNKSQSFEAFTYRVSADYKPQEGLLIYALTSKGFKSGTFNTVSINKDPAVDPETLYDYEIGFKSDPYKDLRINGSAYYYDYKNIQYYSQSTQQQAVLLNAAAATLYGAELSVEARPLQGLMLRGAIGLEHSQYDSFSNAQVYVPAPVAGEKQIFANAKGKQLLQTPNFTGDFGVNYDFDLPDDIGQFTLTTSVYYNSGYPFDPIGQFKQAAYSTVDASGTWKLPGGQWSLMLWGKNLTDERYFTQLTVAGRGARVAYALPQTYGFTINFEFDAADVTADAAPTTYVQPAVQAPAPSPTPRDYVVFFDFNKSDLTPQAIEIVDQAAKNAGPAKVTQLTVTGHTDTIGSDAYNMRLSRRRAEAVAVQLEKDGIPSNEIEIIAKGKRDLLVPTADGVREPQNRRVQIAYAGGAAS
jgi:iron complex outermembrane receptor protein